MDDRQRYYRLGIFVIATLGLAFAVLMTLGGPGLFKSKVMIETYFRESVSGLEVGSPVKFRGVPIGQVKQILLSTQAYPGTLTPAADRGALVVVRAELVGGSGEGLRRDLEAYVHDGLRAQTQLAGITGNLFLSLDFIDPRRFPPNTVEFQWTPEYSYIPSAPSATNQIIQNAQNFLANLDEADIKALVSNVARLADSTEQRVREINVKNINDTVAALHTALLRLDQQLTRAPLDQTMLGLRDVAQQINRLLQDPQIPAAVGDLAQAAAGLRRLADSGEIERILKNLEQVSARTDQIVSGNQDDIRTLIEDLRSSAVNLRALTETAKLYPAGLLFGEPPPPVVLPRQEKK
ncbi:MAG: MlaD family protein [Burkholderiaceae bacterium]